MEDMNDVQNIETVSDGKQYIVVRIGTEQYGIDIKYVDNIVRISVLQESQRLSLTLKVLLTFVVKSYRL